MITDFECTELYKILEQNSVIDINNSIYKALEILPEPIRNFMEEFVGSAPKKLLNLDTDSLNKLIYLAKSNELALGLQIIYDKRCSDGYFISLHICTDFTDLDTTEGVYTYIIPLNLFQRLLDGLVLNKVEFSLETRNLGFEGLPDEFFE